jgi:ankyrin repeat protein
VNPTLVDQTTSHKDLWTGYWPLHMAVWVGNLEIIRELIAAGADINKRDRCLGKTPLGWARRSGSTEVEQVLLELRAEQ